MMRTTSTVLPPGNLGLATSGRSNSGTLNASTASSTATTPASLGSSFSTAVVDTAELRTKIELLSDELGRWGRVVGGRLWLSFWENGGGKQDVPAGQYHRQGGIDPQRHFGVMSELVHALTQDHLALLRAEAAASPQAAAAGFIPAPANPHSPPPAALLHPTTAQAHSGNDEDDGGDTATSTSVTSFSSTFSTTVSSLGSEEDAAQVDYEDSALCQRVQELQLLYITFVSPQSPHAVFEALPSDILHYVTHLTGWDQLLAFEQQEEGGPAVALGEMADPGTEEEEGVSGVPVEEGQMQQAHHIEPAALAALAETVGEEGNLVLDMAGAECLLPTSLLSPVSESAAISKKMVKPPAPTTGLRELPANTQVPTGSQVKTTQVMRHGFKQRPVQPPTLAAGDWAMETPPLFAHQAPQDGQNPQQVQEPNPQQSGPQRRNRLSEEHMRLEMQASTVLHLCEVLIHWTPEGVALACEELHRRLGSEDKDATASVWHSGVELVSALFVSLRRPCTNEECTSVSGNASTKYQQQGDATTSNRSPFVPELLALIQQVLKAPAGGSNSGQSLISSIHNADDMIDVFRSLFDCLLLVQVAEEQGSTFDAATCDCLYDIATELVCPQSGSTVLRFGPTFTALMHHLHTASNIYLEDTTPGALGLKRLQLVGRCLLKQTGRTARHVPLVLQLTHKFLCRFPFPRSEDGDGTPEEQMPLEHLFFVKMLLNKVVRDCEKLGTLLQEDCLQWLMTEAEKVVGRQPVPESDSDSVAGLCWCLQKILTQRRRVQQEAAAELTRAQSVVKEVQEEEEPSATESDLAAPRPNPLPPLGPHIAPPLPAPSRRLADAVAVARPTTRSSSSNRVPSARVSSASSTSGGSATPAPARFVTGLFWDAETLLPKAAETFGATLRDCTTFFSAVLSHLQDQVVIRCHQQQQQGNGPRHSIRGTVFLSPSTVKAEPQLVDRLQRLESMGLTSIVIKTAVCLTAEELIKEFVQEHAQARVEVNLVLITARADFAGVLPEVTLNVTPHVVSAASPDSEHDTILRYLAEGNVYTIEDCLASTVGGAAASTVREVLPEMWGRDARDTTAEQALTLEQEAEAALRQWQLKAKATTGEGEVWSDALDNAPNPVLFTQTTATTTWSSSPLVVQVQGTGAAGACGGGSHAAGAMKLVELTMKSNAATGAGGTEPASPKKRGRELSLVSTNAAAQEVKDHDKKKSHHLQQAVVLVEDEKKAPASPSTSTSCWELLEKGKGEGKEDSAVPAQVHVLEPVVEPLWPTLDFSGPEIVLVQLRTRQLRFRALKSDCLLPGKDYVKVRSNLGLGVDIGLVIASESGGGVKVPVDPKANGEKKAGSSLFHHDDTRDTALQAGTNWVQPDYVTGSLEPEVARVIGRATADEVERFFQLQKTDAQTLARLEKAGNLNAGTAEGAMTRSSSLSSSKTPTNNGGSSQYKVASACWEADQLRLNIFVWSFHSIDNISFRQAVMAHLGLDRSHFVYVHRLWAESHRPLGSGGWMTPAGKKLNFASDLQLYDPRKPRDSRFPAFTEVEDLQPMIDHKMRKLRQKAMQQVAEMVAVAPTLDTSTPSNKKRNGRRERILTRKLET